MASTAGRFGTGPLRRKIWYRYEDSRLVLAEIGEPGSIDSASSSVSCLVDAVAPMAMMKLNKQKIVTMLALTSADCTLWFLRVGFDMLEIGDERSSNLTLA